MKSNSHLIHLFQDGRTGGRTGGHVPKNLSKSFRNSGPVQFFWTGKSCGLGGEMCKNSY